MRHTDENDFPYYLSTDEMKEDGLTPIKVTSLLQFFTLAGKKSVLSKDNLIPIPNLTYVVLAKYPGGDRYFLREFHNYSIDELYFYRQTETFSGQSTAIENLRKYVSDRRVTLLYTSEQVADTQDMLRRLYKAEFKTEGQLDYKLYLTILEQNLLYEDYRDTGKSLTGFKTVCNQFQLRIAELWKSAKK
jgi:hypothetical protein